MRNEPAARDAGRSIWLRPARSGRGPSPEHSAAEIAKAAVALADANGLDAVTMRAVAAAIGTAPASLYRYFDSRNELLELMSDQVAGEHSADARGTGDAVADLLALAHETLAIYRRHRWLLDIPATGGLPGPNALAYMDRLLGVLNGSGLGATAKFEVVGLLTGAVRSFAQLEADQRRAGQDAEQWQNSVAAYLTQVAAAGKHPNLAATLAAAGRDDAVPQQSLFDRATTRILTGLLTANPPTAPE
jgi:AcrR family transcriptional regulator